MLARVITLRFEPEPEAFGDAPLRDFVKRKYDQNCRSILPAYLIVSSTRPQKL